MPITSPRVTSKRRKRLFQSMFEPRAQFTSVKIVYCEVTFIELVLS